VSVVQSEHVFNPEVLLSAAGSGKNVARYGERTAVFQQGETGDGEQARQAFQQLIAGQPAWGARTRKANCASCSPRPSWSTGWPAI